MSGTEDTETEKYFSHVNEWCQTQYNTLSELHPHMGLVL